jgi:DNA-binding IclR family transcriptional regulator
MINSIRKAIHIMNMFSAAEPRLTLTEISRRLNIPKSTVHSLLSTLLTEGFIEQLDDGSYALGTAVIVLTQRVRVNVELRDRAAPYLRQLADQCGESVYLTIRDGDFVLYIYAIESSRRLIARTAVGDRAHLHCTGVGKAILAELPAEEVTAMVGRVGLPTVTKYTTSTLPQLQTILEQTRERGYSFDNQENELGNYCIGAALYDGTGQVIGACSVAGTDPEIIGARSHELAQNLLTAALAISRNMGFVPASLARLNHTPR